MKDFREYVKGEAKEPSPTSESPDELHLWTDETSQLADSVLYLFALTSEGSRETPDGKFAVKLRPQGDNLVAKFEVATRKDEVAVRHVYTSDTPPEEVVLGLLEGVRRTILQNYHPDPNMHECQWTRYEWAKRGRSLLNVLDRVYAIPRIRQIQI